MAPEATAWLDKLRAAALQSGQIRGLSHNFYRYPARFSPQFVGAAIELFSRPGEIVLDPFMGGGTSVLEAYARGRRAIGVDLNQLAAFVVRSKTYALTKREADQVRAWFADVFASFNYQRSLVVPGTSGDDNVRHLTGPQVRPIRKALRFALGRIDDLRSSGARRFSRCVLLSASQWALDGRRDVPTLLEYRSHVAGLVDEMLAGLHDLRGVVATHESPTVAPSIHCGRAQALLGLPPFRDGAKADMVVTSPPYPGVHVLYHRWQIDGRRETAAPYWIANCRDGRGASYYNFGSRHDPAQQDYFEAYGASLRAIRACMKDGGIIVQMIACRRPDLHLGRVASEVASAGFAPLSPDGSATPIARTVPWRKWHAASKGSTPSSCEHVLVHEAV